MKGEQSTSQSQPIKFDTQRCRAAKLIDLYAECLVQEPSFCPFGLGFGDGRLCKHPARDQIIIRTQQLSKLI